MGMVTAVGAKLDEAALQIVGDLHIIQNGNGVVVPLSVHLIRGRTLLGLGEGFRSLGIVGEQAKGRRVCQGFIRRASVGQGGELEAAAHPGGKLLPTGVRRIGGLGRATLPWIGGNPPRQAQNDRQYHGQCHDYSGRSHQSTDTGLCPYAGLVRDNGNAPLG